MKQEWLVENEDARKALHDLYFETGSLPDQQPKAKVKEPEKSIPAGGADQTGSLREAVNDPSTRNSIAEFSRNWGVKAAASIALVLLLSFGAYRVMPKFGPSSTKTVTHHIKSPLIREALEKRQEANPLAPGGNGSAALGSLAVTPTVIMAEFQPGKSTTQTLTIDNQTPQAMTFEMDAEDLVAQGEQLILVPAGDSPNSVAATAVFSEKFVQVGPMDKATVQVTLTWPSATAVQGVVAQLRRAGDVRLGGTGLMATSLGTLITFVGGPGSGQSNGESPAGLQPSGTQPLTISQWAGQSGSGNTEAPRNSMGVKNPNQASLGGTQ